MIEKGLEILAGNLCLKIKQSWAQARQGIRVELATPLPGSQDLKRLVFPAYAHA